jgi:hypothetical protein
MMTRKRLRWALLIPLLLAVCGGAQAQITAAQSIPGFYVQQGTDGCTAVTGCFIPYSATYPLPTTGGGGGSNASVGATGSAVPGSATYLGISIAGTLTGLTAGQATMANSVPVVIASNQSNLPNNIAAWAGTTLGPPSNYGTSPGAVAVPGVNAFVTNTPAVTQSGIWTVTGAGGSFPVTGSSSNASSAVATSSTNVPNVSFSYGFNGTTWDQLQVDTAKSLKVNPIPLNIPAAGTVSAIVTGGTAVTLITGPVNGCYVTNPLTASDQNIATAEVAQVNPVTTATAAGRGTNSTLQPGQTFTCPAGMTTNLSAIAATTAHAFNVVKW